MKGIKVMRSYRLHPKQIEYLEIMAEKNFMPISQYINYLINEDMKKNIAIAKENLKQ